MKKIGEYTARGTIFPETTPSERLTLFDGRFDTGHVITNVQCAPQDMSSTNEAYLILSTEPLPAGITADNWDWGSNIQIGWAYFKLSLGSNEGGLVYSNIDKDNLVIEDLYLTALTDITTKHVNYEITMEKYEFDEWKGALAMVRNKSQA